MKNLVSTLIPTIFPWTLTADLNALVKRYLFTKLHRPWSPRLGVASLRLWLI